MNADIKAARKCAPRYYHSYDSGSLFTLLSSTLLCKFESSGSLHSPKLFAGRAATAHLDDVRPAASVCRQPQDLRSSACGRRWPAAWRSASPSSHPAEPETSEQGVYLLCGPRYVST